MLLDEDDDDLDLDTQPRAQRAVAPQPRADVPVRRCGENCGCQSRQTPQVMEPPAGFTGRHYGESPRPTPPYHGTLSAFGAPGRHPDDAEEDELIPRASLSAAPAAVPAIFGAPGVCGDDPDVDELVPRPPMNGAVDDEEDEDDFDDDEDDDDFDDLDDDEEEGVFDDFDDEFIDDELI